MKNTFTTQQEKQIRKALDVLMQCGTAHISLCDLTPDRSDPSPIYGHAVQWFTVRACMSGKIKDPLTGEVWGDDRRYEISVGQFVADRRRKILTSLDMNQHNRQSIA
jgi:hypothetical protein